jgi:hypothetical protein
MAVEQGGTTRAKGAGGSTRMRHAKRDGQKASTGQRSIAKKNATVLAAPHAIDAAALERKIFPAEPAESF